MLVRWILPLLLLPLTLSVNAIQRPDPKTTLRGLTRLPRIEMRFSLDFEADRGFVAFRTSKDPILAVADLRGRLDGSPDDTKVLLDIAALRLDAGDFANARREFQRAADALRKRLASEPGDSRLRLDLADALHGLGRQAEAESVFRDLVKQAPNSTTNQVAFSAFLEARAWEIASNLTNWRGRRPYDDLCRATVRRQPSTETADLAAKMLEESLEAARRAVELDDRSSAAQRRLAIATASKECFESLRGRISGRDIAAPPFETMVFRRSALPGLERAAQLEPRNPAHVATVSFWRALAEAADRRIPVSEFSRHSIWEFLSDEDRRHVEEGIERLSELGGSSNSGAALQALGTLRFVLQNDLRGAADDLRLAIGDISESEQLWETLSLVLHRTGNYFEWAAVCEARTLVRPNVRNRVLLAKAHEKLGNIDRAIAEALGALALNANDFTANVALANLLLRVSDENGVSPRVRQSLVNAERAIRANATGAQLIELALAQSIYHGLVDDFDRAREILKAALSYSKDNPEVTAALNAIGY